MTSRYDFMQESQKGVDPKDGIPYPDPLSISYRNTQLTSIPPYTEIEERYIDRFWALMYDYYNLTELDDILLMLNNVPYIGTLEPGSNIYLISLNDLQNFATQKQPGA